MLWGDFPWSAPPPKVGKLLSIGATARNVTRALNELGHVVPYAPAVEPATPRQRRAALMDFLTSIDIVWADLYPESEPALRLRRRLGLACPAVLFVGGVMPKGAEAMLFPWRGLLTPADHLVFTCEADRAIWRTLVRQSDLQESVISLGTDDTIFHPRSREERTATRTQHHLPQAAPLLLYVGRLNIQKNLHSLLRLFRAVRSAIPSAHLCLVGEEDDIVLGEFGVRNTGYMAWLGQLAARLGVAEGMTYVGVQLGQNLAQLYAAADVLVNLSVYHRENFGLAQAEAQACGVPVVCTAWGGFKDVVREGETGYFVDAVMTKCGIRVDWATGAQRVIRLLSDPSLHAQMSEKAHVWARQQFSIMALARALAPIIAAAHKPEERARRAGPVYEPSAFARRYEAHKRTCGWYAPDSQQFRQWYPPMFQGRDYTLYETLLGPYATDRASSLSAQAIDATWVPYIASGIQVDPVRRLVEDHDLIWPQRRFLQPFEWDILQLVDGSTSVEQIINILRTQHQDPSDDVRTILQYLYITGIIMIRRVDDEATSESITSKSKPLPIA
jgi:glycosyltransferase involved in cell wall biosynthesis